jgi:hypothetical protein
MIINPRRMRCRVTVVVLCVYLSVCLSVTTLTATYLIYESKVRCYKATVPYQWHSKRMYCANFAKNALFPSFGIIC